MLSLFSFRPRAPDGVEPDGYTLALLEAVNRDGRIYLTQTSVDGRAAIRFQAGSVATTEADVAAVPGVLAAVRAAMDAQRP